MASADDNGLKGLKVAIASGSVSSVEEYLNAALGAAVSSQDLSAVRGLCGSIAQQLCGVEADDEDEDVNEVAKAVLSPEEEQARMVASVETALASVAAGEFVVVVDGDDRENEGDLIIAAEKATPERLAFMVNETSGLICVGVTEERVKQLELPQMVSQNTEAHATAFTHSVDYLIGTTTGISAGDRALTIKALADEKVKPAELSRPGHVFPLRAREGGVLTRPGHTEASVDLARLAGCYPAGAMCEIVNKDGSMTRPKDLQRFSKKHNLNYVTIKDLIAYRKLTGK